ncbi:endonuclease/exonuclease/phosphatase family protein [Nocardioides sp. R1-1]|uniref:endonuclease/exonuclease/phosphatase family protein n=1 Tax=Nocardioides sp. R1-1 TaxID=3383502 RepID=UPI0038D1D336
MLSTTTRRLGRALLILLSATAVVAGVLAPTAPASAADSPVPWVAGQDVRGQKVAVTLAWDGVPGAASYTVHWTQGYGAPLDSPHQSTGPIHGTSTVIEGLEPGTTYCFSVDTGTRACKVTPPTSRAVKPGAFATTAATFNVACGSKSKCNGGWKWKKRQKQVVDRIGRMNADIMVFTEAHVAHKYGKKKRWIGKVMKKRGYTLACQTQRSKKRKLFSQVAYVRSSAYAVVDRKRTSKGSRFTRFGDRDHGYCHALVQHRATGRTLALAALHLHDGEADAARQQETAYVLGKLQARFGGQPTLLLGDFNSHRGRDRKGESDTPRLVLEGAGFADASDIAAWLTLPYLNSANGFEVDPPRSKEWPTHVDRVFVSPGITVPAWENLAVLDGAGRYATPMASDHNPIKVTLNIP